MANNDVIQAKQVIDDLTASFDKHNQSIENTAKTLNDYSNTIIELPSKIKQMVDAFTSNLNMVKQETQAIEANVIAVKANEEGIKKLVQSRQQNATKTSEEIVNNRILAQNADNLAKQNSALAGAYQNLVAKKQAAAKALQDLIVTGKDAEQTQKQYNEQLKVAQKEYDTLNSKVKQADVAIGKFNSNVGNYPSIVSGVKSLVNAFGLFSGVYLAAQVMKDAFNTLREFEKANADLAAYMGKSIPEIAGLTEEQKRLAIATRYTTVEIAGVQKELAKSGFNDSQIKEATLSVLNFASAIGVDLETSVQVTDTVLKTFNLNTSQTQKVVDVMGKSFSSSRLRMEDFKESIKYVAPIANSLHVPFEKVVALLSILADNGIKGSMAGTSLRRILADLTKTGGDFNTEFNKLIKNGISVKDAFDEVGRTAQTTLIVLGQHKDKIDELTKSYENAGGTVEKMAKTQLDTLDGKIHILTSSWEVFIVSLNKSDGVISKTLSSFINGINIVINKVTELNTSWSELFKQSQTKGAQEGIEQFSYLMKDFKPLSNDEKQKIKDRISEINKEILTAKGNQPAVLNSEKEQLGLQLVNSDKKIVVNTILNNERENFLKIEKEIKENTKKLAEYKKNEFKAVYDYGMSESSMNKIQQDAIRRREASAKIIGLAKLELDKVDSNSGENPNGNKKPLTDEEIALQIALKKALNKEIEAELQLRNKLNIAIAERELMLLKEKQNDEKLYFSERLDLVSKVAEKETEIATKKYQDELILNQIKNKNEILEAKSLKQKELINKKYQEDAQISAIKFANDLTEIDKKKTDKELAELSKYYKAFDEYHAKYDGEGLKLNLFGEDPKKSFEEYQKKEKETLEKSKKEIDDYLQSFVTKFGNESGFPSLFKILNKEIKGFGKNWKVTFDAMAEVSKEAFAFINKNSQKNYDAEYARLEKQHSISIAFAGNSAAAKTEIDRQYEEERKKIAQKQAESKKEEAIFNIILSTAEAIVGALPNIPLSIAIGAIGALELGLAQNAPLPQYWTGTDNAKGGLAIVDEYRPEVHTDKKGNIKSFGSEKGANFRMTEQGDKIYKSRENYFNKELKSILAQNQISPFDMNLQKEAVLMVNNNVSGGLSKEDFEKGIERLVNKQEVEMNISKKGLEVYVKEGHTKKQHLNDLFTSKGKIV